MKCDSILHNTITTSQAPQNSFILGAGIGISRSITFWSWSRWSFPFKVEDWWPFASINHRDRKISTWKICFHPPEIRGISLFFLEVFYLLMFFFVSNQRPSNQRPPNCFNPFPKKKQVGWQPSPGFFNFQAELQGAVADLIVFEGFKASKMGGGARPGEPCGILKKCRFLGVCLFFWNTPAQTPNSLSKLRLKRVIWSNSWTSQ